MNTPLEEPRRRRSVLWFVAIVAAFLSGWLFSANGTSESAAVQELTNDVEELRSFVEQAEAERDQAVAELINAQEMLDDSRERIKELDDSRARDKERIERLARYPGLVAASSYRLVLLGEWTATLTLVTVDAPAAVDLRTWLFLVMEDADPNLEVAVESGTCQELEEVSMGSISNVVVGPNGRLTHVQPNLALDLEDSSFWIRLSTDSVPEGPGVRSFFHGGELVDDGQVFASGDNPCET